MRAHRSLMLLLVALGLLAPLADAYVRTTVESATRGNPLKRRDFADIPFLVGSGFAPGTLNTAGRPMITANSDPSAALQAAADSWSGIEGSSVRFRVLGTTSAAAVAGDGQHVVVLRDTAEIRAALGGALAATFSRFQLDGTLIDTDIVFNPNIVMGGTAIPFSTNQEPGTFDLMTIAAHEFGHTLGADHTAVQLAGMFPSTAQGSATRDGLRTDDLAFLRTAYPAAGTQGSFGSVSGRVTMAGAPVRGAHVALVDVTAGRVIGGVTSIQDGTYRIDSVPPGTYLLSAEPLHGPVRPAHLNLPDSAVDVNFQAAFLGGNATPQDIVVTGGAIVTADLAVAPGAAAIRIDSTGLGTVGGTGDYRSFGAGPKVLQSNTVTDLVISGTGLAGTTDAHIRMLGPGLRVRPGSVRVDSVIMPGASPLRLTLEIAAGATREASLAIVRDGTLAIHTGVFLIRGAANAPNFTAAGFVNAAAFRAGGAAAEGIYSLFGANMADSIEAATTTPLPTSLAGSTVEVVDSAGTVRASPQFFLSAGQGNFQVPPGTLSGAGRLRVRRADGVSSETPVNIVRVDPGLFTARESGAGVAAAFSLRVAADGARTQALIFNPNTREAVPVNLGPASDQVFLLLFGTGIRHFANSVTATVGGLAVPVLGAVAQGEFVGLDQVNIGPMPRALIGRGEVQIVLVVDGRPANAVTVTIQ